MPSLLDKQGAKLFAVALLVVSRTWISDRIASLNGNAQNHGLIFVSMSSISAVCILVISVPIWADISNIVSSTSKPYMVLPIYVGIG